MSVGTVFGALVDDLLFDAGDDAPAGSPTEIPGHYIPTMEAIPAWFVHNQHELHELYEQARPLQHRFAGDIYGLALGLSLIADLVAYWPQPVQERFRERLAYVMVAYALDKRLR